MQPSDVDLAQIYQDQPAGRGNPLGSGRECAPIHVDHFQAAAGRVLVATFASLIARVQQIVDVAIRHNRKVSLLGRSMVNNMTMSLERGYLKAHSQTIIPLEQLNSLPTYVLYLYLQYPNQRYLLSGDE